jgi:ribonucleoside-diphosphate reductase alpha chain
MTPTMRPQPIAINILREKYARAGERTMADVLDRVTRGLAAVEPEPERWEPAFREALRAGASSPPGASWPPAGWLGRRAR